MYGYDVQVNTLSRDDQVQPVGQRPELGRYTLPGLSAHDDRVLMLVTVGIRCRCIAHSDYPTVSQSISQPRSCTVPRYSPRWKYFISPGKRQGRPPSLPIPFERVAATMAVTDMRGGLDMSVCM